MAIKFSRSHSKSKRINYIKDLGLNRLGFHSSEIMEDCKVQRLISSCCPRNSQGKASNKECGWKIAKNDQSQQSNFNTPCKRRNGVS